MRFGSALMCAWTCGVLLGCFEDPVMSDGDGCSAGEFGCACLPNSTCSGDLVCVQGLCLEGDGETGDGDGDAGDGDGEPGDGDGDPGETVVYDLYIEACSLTTTWVSEATDLGPDGMAIPCDMMGTNASGWMLRHPQLTVGSTTFENVISLVPAHLTMAQIQGAYNIDHIPNAADLEFRAEVLLRCADGDPECVGRFALAVAEGVPNGLFAEIDDRMLGSGMQPIAIAVPLLELLTLTEPTVVLIAERTEELLQETPELLIVRPRLVLP